jgi:hypothetical protein
MKHPLLTAGAVLGIALSFAQWSTEGSSDWENFLFIAVVAAAAAACVWTLAGWWARRQV